MSTPRSTLDEIARLRIGDKSDGPASDELIAFRFGVRLEVHAEGSHYGHRGHLVTLDGVKVGEGGLAPYGMTEVAATKAAAAASRRGWRVVR